MPRQLHFNIFKSTLPFLVVFANLGRVPLIFAKRLPSSAHLLSLRPSQETIGMAAAQAKLDGWLEEAKSQNLPFKKFVQTVLKKRFDEAPLPAILDPKGNIRITDGHHKTWALRKLYKESGLHFEIRIDIQDDFRGLSKKQYRYQMVRKYPVAGIDANRRTSSIANTFRNLKDNPMRAMVGLTLRRMGISSITLKEYAQFSIIKKLLSDDEFTTRLKKMKLINHKGEVSSKAPTTPEALDYIHELLSSKSVYREFIRQQARDDASRRVINESLVKYAATPHRVFFPTKTTKYRHRDATANLTRKAKPSKRAAPIVRHPNR